MIVGGKDKARIPIGKMINSMETMVGNRIEFCESLCNTRYMIVYDKNKQRAYVEERDHMNQFVSRFETYWSTKEYMNLYLSLVDLIKNCSTIYFGTYKVYGIYIGKSIRSKKPLKDKIKLGLVDIHVASTVRNAFDQFTKSHPYLVDDIDECSIEPIHQDDIEVLCNDKLEIIKSLFETKEEY